MGSKQAAAADVTIAVIPAPADASSSSSSSTVKAQPGMRTFSALQVVHGIFYGAPVLPLLEDGYPAGAEELLRLVVDGHVRGVVVGTLNSYLRACGRIPMVCPEGPIDLNAPPPDAGQPPAERRPVICAYCNCAFCFGEYELTALNRPSGIAYPQHPGPATADFVTPPPVGPLYGDGALPAPGATPVPLPVCSNLHHFMVAMGMLKLPYDAPSLVWKRPSSLGVLPIVVGRAGGRLQRDEITPGGCSSGLHAPAAPPPDPSTYAGAYWNFVMPGHEDMVDLAVRPSSVLDRDPLDLTLGW